ncbi:hypothetical protein FNF27_07772 [Cafeteria roenbergensis]|uniref:Signal recognition particle 19 kDa protein n=2 Tax=Cafeteria roenbergensis TaxID=33653 RepID=A0A5A8DAZ1_CAFRO|nr:hypothetical protein FNF31_03171 [Cafeteria roenbergensis]KAA0164631.1 hypothetical protein FNF27_07772 [Cafeteria roenbergensis]KAA0170704.1 hypothetical protein FNF28_01248 [Cafeteria roenbergensis]
MAATGGAARELPKDLKSWSVIYPCYVDSSKKCAEGRKISKAKCEGCDAPHPLDLAEAALLAGYPREGGIVIEPRKRHPRDFFSEGRIRIRLKDEEGKPVVEGITTKQQLLEALAKHIPSTPGRESRKQAMKVQDENTKAQVFAMISGRPAGPPAGAPRPATGAGGPGPGAAAQAAAPAKPAASKSKPKKGKVVKKKPKKGK